MTNPAWIADLFAAIDRQDADGFADLLTEDVVFTFGNGEPVLGSIGSYFSVDPDYDVENAPHEMAAGRDPQLETAIAVILKQLEKEPQTPCQRIIDHSRESGNDAVARALEKWRAGLDPFEMKGEIESRLRKLWELDRKLSGAEYLTESERGLLARATVLEGHFRYAPMPLQNRKYRPESAKKSNPNKDATEAPIPA